MDHAGMTGLKLQTNGRVDERDGKLTEDELPGLVQNDAYHAVVETDRFEDVEERVLAVIRTDVGLFPKTGRIVRLRTKFFF